MDGLQLRTPLSIDSEHFRQFPIEKSRRLLFFVEPKKKINPQKNVIDQKFVREKKIAFCVGF